MTTYKLYKLLALGIMVVVIFSGCALYRSEADYDKGIWWDQIATSGEVARIQRDKENLREQKEYWDLSIQKLKSESTSTEAKSTDGKSQGFQGIIDNLSPVRANFIIKSLKSRLMTKSYFLNPGQNQEDNLLPGEYEVLVFVSSVPVGKRKFTVGPQQQNYNGQNVYWYVFYDPCPTKSSYFQVGQQTTVYCGQL